MSNNPPDISLELTTQQGQFLLDNCDKNIIFALNAIQAMPDIAEKLVPLLEGFKEIREILIKQGLKSK